MDSDLKGVLTQIAEMLGTITSQSNTITPTLLYNEGWLMRLVLQEAARGTNCLPFRIDDGSRWFSEVLLPSTFRARSRADHLAEGTTHADAVVGHFTFGDATKSGLVLNHACEQLIICEAKMFSGLSPGTSRVRSFDQGARTVACIAEAISRSGQPVTNFKSIGFYVFAPKVQIDRGVFANQLSRGSILAKIKDRIELYRAEKEFSALAQWNEKWVVPVMEKIDIGCISWESVISAAQCASDYGNSLMTFYRNCLNFNARAIDSSQVEN